MSSSFASSAQCAAHPISVRKLARVQPRCGSAGKFQSSRSSAAGLPESRDARQPDLRAFGPLRWLLQAGASGLRTTRIVRASISTALFLAAVSGSATATNAKPKSPLAPYSGTWAPTPAQCKDPVEANQRLSFHSDTGEIVDSRTGNISCRLEKARVYPDGANFGLICEIGQESPFNFRTDYTVLRKDARTIALTNSFVDRKPNTLDYVRCDPKDLPRPLRQ